MSLNGPLAKLQKKLQKDPATVEGYPKEEGLKVGALNVGSIQDDKRLEDLKTFIARREFDIFVVAETNLNSAHHPHSKLTLDNYTLVRKDRLFAKKEGRDKKQKCTGKQARPIPRDGNGHGGGLLIYIRNTLQYKVKSIGEYAECNLEFLHLQITEPVEFHLVALYNPRKEFVDHLISIMSYFIDALGDRDIMFVGDTNIDRCGSKHEDKFGNMFFDVLTESYGVRTLIEHMTNITVRDGKNSETCLDRIFTNLKVKEQGVMSRIITSNAKSYHRGIYCTIEISSKKKVDEDLQTAVYTYTASENDEQEKPEGLHQKLEPELADGSCILAVFYQFPESLDVPEIKEDSDVKIYAARKEMVCYVIVNDECSIDNSVKEIKKYTQSIDKTKNVKKFAQEKIFKQCIIFTRNSKSKMFNALQKEMWFRDWDFIWQPRHVQFLDHVLEPSLTMVYPIDGRTPLFEGHNGPTDKKEEITWQESTYRYWSENWKQITQL